MLRYTGSAKDVVERSFPMLDENVDAPVAPVPGDIRTGCLAPQVKPGGM